MIHYLLLLRPITFQHEHPPPAPPPPSASFYHYPHYQHRPNKVNPTKPQKPQHQQKQEAPSVSRAVVGTPSAQLHVKTSTASRENPQQQQKCRCNCNCLNYTLRENKQSRTTGNNDRFPSVTHNQSNLWQVRKSGYQFPIARIDSSSYRTSESLVTSKRTAVTQAASSSPSSSALSNHGTEKVTPPQTSQSSSASAASTSPPPKIKSSSNFPQRRKRSLCSTRKILSTFRQLHFPFSSFSFSAFHRSKHYRSVIKKKVLREEEEEEEEYCVSKEKDADSGKYLSGKQVPESVAAGKRQGNHHHHPVSFQSTAEENKPTPSFLLTSAASSTVNVETNKLVKRSITVKSSTAKISSSNPVAVPGTELDCLESLLLRSRNAPDPTSTATATASLSPQKEGNIDRTSTQEGETSNGNCCSNIHNNNRKKGSKNFEKLKKFLLFCKGLRRKSK